MYLKLAKRNTFRSMKIYIAYFLTILLSVILMYCFLSLACSSDILSLSDNMGAFKNTVIALTALTAIMVAFVVRYATSFIIGQRKKEFAVYKLLGMEQTYINRMLYIENLITFLIAALLGILLGTLLSEAAADYILQIFDMPQRYGFQMSFTAILYTLLFCGLIQVITVIQIVKTLKHQTILDLMYDSQKNEHAQIHLSFKQKLLFLAAFVLIGIGFYLVYYGLTCNTQMAWVYIAAALVCVISGIYRIYRYFPLMLTAWMNGFKNWKHYGTNVFLLKQLNSRINTSGKVMAVAAILLTISMFTLAVGLFMGAGYKEEVARYAPYDIALKIDGTVSDFAPELEAIKKQAVVKDFVDYKLYEDSNFPEMAVLALSDYNHIRRQLELEPLTLGEHSYLIHCEWIYTAQIEDELNQGKGTIQVGGSELSPDGGIHTEVLEQQWMAGTNGYAIVVPDIITQTLKAPKSRLIVTTASPAPKELKETLYPVISKHLQPFIVSGEMPEKTTIGVLVQSWTKANSLTGYIIISLCSLYMGIIFIILVCTLLGFRQLAAAEKNRQRYQTLWKLGISNSELKSLARKEMMAFFAIPLVLPFLITAISMAGLNKMYSLQMASTNLIGTYAFLAISIFMVIYVVYYWVTYSIYVRLTGLKL